MFNLWHLRGLLYFILSHAHEGHCALMNMLNTTQQQPRFLLAFYRLYSWFFFYAYTHRGRFDKVELQTSWAFHKEAVVIVRTGATLCL